MAFTSKVLQALNSEEVQSKICHAVFKLAWDTSITSFGEDVGNKVGLAYMRQDFKHKLQQLKTDLARASKTDFKEMAKGQPRDSETIGAADSPKVFSGSPDNRKWHPNRPLHSRSAPNPLKIISGGSFEKHIKSLNLTAQTKRFSSVELIALNAFLQVFENIED